VIESFFHAVKQLRLMEKSKSKWNKKFLNVNGIQYEDIVIVLRQCDNVAITQNPKATATGYLQL